MEMVPLLLKYSDFTTALKAEIDQLVYQLYDLSPEVVAIVEGQG